MKLILHLKRDKESSIFGILITLYLICSIFEGYSPELSQISSLVILFLILYLIFNIRKMKINFMHFILMVWIIYYFTSLIWGSNTDFDQAEVYINTMLSMPVLFVLLTSRPYTEKFINYCINLYYFLSICLGMVSLFSYTYIGAGTRRVTLLFGNYIDPNNQAALLAIGTAIALYRLVFLESNKRKVLDFIALTINTAGILLTGSRSGIIILALQILVSLYLMWKDSSKKKFLSKLFIILVLMIVGLILAFNFFPPEIIDRLFGLGDLKFTDGTEREIRWLNGLQIWLQHPLFGNGWGAFESHNTFLTFLLDTGIVGILLFSCFLGILITKLLKNKTWLGVLLLITGLVPSFFIGAQNKRFFWNCLIIPGILLMNKSLKEKCVKSD